MDNAMVKSAKLNAFLAGVSNTPAVQVQDREGQKFLANLSGPDPEDRKWTLMSQNLLAKNADGDFTGMTRDGMVAVAPDSWYNWMARKVDRQLLANYEGWAIDQIDLSKPESAEFWSRILPWVREKREQLLEEQANIQKQLALIKIRGVQSEDDMMLLFAVQNKLISVSPNALYNLDATDTWANNEKVSTKFTGGLLNPFSKFFITDDKVLNTQGADNGGGDRRVPVYSFTDPLNSKSSTFPATGLGLGAANSAEAKSYTRFRPTF